MEELNDKEIQGLAGEYFHDSFIGAMKGLAEESKKQNVAIFVDYDNVYITLDKKHGHDPNHEDSEKNLFERLWKTYGQAYVRTFRVYADFEKIRSNLTDLQRKRVQLRHVYSNGKSDDRRKNSSDIELCLDALETSHRDDKIQTYVFVTADSDMIPIMSRMMYKGKRVELYYLGSASSPHITNYAHQSVDLKDFLGIEDKIYNPEEFLFESLLLIKEWYERNKGKSNYLGKPFLNMHLSKGLAQKELPGDIISKIIELLEVRNLIEKIEYNENISITVSESGEQYIATNKQVATTK